MSTRAHTVPKFYLCGFAAAESEDSHDPFVWVGTVATGVIARRSPKNMSIVRGLYDGRGGFADSLESIEGHLAKIESAAASAIRRFTTQDATAGGDIPPEITRFLAWQAARTPGWMEFVERWANDVDGTEDIVEPPPPGIERIKDRSRPLLLENPETGERHETADSSEFGRLRKLGWKWLLRRDDHLEMLHMQAWYFQVRHFPRLAWIKLTAPEDQCFVTSDRAVAWLVDGYADSPPAALRHPAAQIVAPLTRQVALVGRHGASRLQVTPREVNRFVAFAASTWIAGPTADVVEQALADRRTSQLA